MLRSGSMAQASSMHNKSRIMKSIRGGGIKPMRQPTSKISFSNQTLASSNFDPKKLMSQKSLTPTRQSEAEEEKSQEF